MCGGKLNQKYTLAERIVFDLFNDHLCWTAAKASTSPELLLLEELKTKGKKRQAAKAAKHFNLPHYY